MAVKGATAKVAVIEKIKQVFGEDFVGVSDGKIYVMADDGTEKVQIAIGMTCPKVPYSPGGDVDFAKVSDTPKGLVDAYEPAKMDERELANVRALIAEFGL